MVLANCLMSPDLSFPPCKIKGLDGWPSLWLRLSMATDRRKISRGTIYDPSLSTSDLSQQALHSTLCMFQLIYPYNHLFDRRRKNLTFPRPQLIKDRARTWACLPQHLCYVHFCQVTQIFQICNEILSCYFVEKLDIVLKPFRRSTLKSLYRTNG